MTHYKGRISSWDVVNEPVVPWSRRSDSLYPGIWLDLLGTEYIDIAFHAAAAADPSALRVLNIYNVEQGTSDDELTRGKTLTLLKQLIARGAPVQAVAFESHLDAAEPFGGTAFQQFINEIRAMKLKVLITELDVKENRAVGDSLSWDRTAAQYYKDYLTEVIQAADPEFVIFWTVNDRWENGKRIQGLMQNSMSPRLTYSAAAQALRGSPCRE
jgi:endo-1,4-beta-xylanase